MDAVDAVLLVLEEPLGAQPCPRHQVTEMPVIPGGHRVTVRCIQGRSGEALEGALSLGVKEANTFPGVRRMGGQ